jgi:hypothetical protein
MRRVPTNDDAQITSLESLAIDQLVRSPAIPLSPHLKYDRSL